MATRKFEEGNRVKIVKGIDAGKFTGTIVDYESYSGSYQVRYDNPDSDGTMGRWYKSSYLDKCLQLKDVPVGCKVKIVNPKSPYNNQIGIVIRLDEKEKKSVLVQLSSNVRRWSEPETELELRNFEKYDFKVGERVKYKITQCTGTITGFTAYVALLRVCEGKEIAASYNNLLKVVEDDSSSKLPDKIDVEYANKHTVKLTEDNFKPGMEAFVDPRVETMVPTIREHLGKKVILIRQGSYKRMVFTDSFDNAWSQDYFCIPAPEASKETESPKWKVGSSISEFKAGMTVRVRPDLKESNGITHDMVRLAGQTFKVSRVDTDSLILDIPNDMPWIWTPSDLEIPVQSETSEEVKDHPKVKDFPIGSRVMITHPDYAGQTGRVLGWVYKQTLVVNVELDEDKERVDFMSIYLQPLGESDSKEPSKEVSQEFKIGDHVLVTKDSKVAGQIGEIINIYSFANSALVALYDGVTKAEIDFNKLQLVEKPSIPTGARVECWRNVESSSELKSGQIVRIRPDIPIRMTGNSEAAFNSIVKPLLHKDLTVKYIAGDDITLSYNHKQICFPWQALIIKCDGPMPELPTTAEPDSGDSVEEQKATLITCDYKEFSLDLEKVELIGHSHNSIQVPVIEKMPLLGNK